MKKVSYCPKCGENLEEDPDGGWCSKCETYWDNCDLDEDDIGWN